MADTDRNVVITKKGDAISPWFTNGGIKDSQSITLYAAKVEWNVQKSLLAVEKPVSNNSQSTKANISMIWDLKKINSLITVHGKLANISGGADVRTQRNILLRMMYDGGPCFLDLGESVSGSTYNQFSAVHTQDSNFEIHDLNEIYGYLEKVQIRDSESANATELIAYDPDIGLFDVIIQFRIGTKK